MQRPDPEAFLPLTPVAFEILLALAAEPRHGYDIMLEIERRTGGRVSLNPGTLYRALDRLVTEGLLDASLQPADTKARDRRRVFSISRLGASVAEAEAARLADQLRAARAVRLVRKGGA